MNDKIKQLNDQIQSELNKIKNCSHEFGAPYSNPETVMEPYGYRMVAMGSDVWGESEGVREVTKPRWTRVCKKCGLEEHTNKVEPIFSGYKPKFN